MPAIQFSIAPWDVGEEALMITRMALKLREKTISKMLSLAKEACRKLEPICRPLWWLDPDDENTYGIIDQFAIGSDIIVAPVVNEGQFSRDIYLTAGQWYEVGQPEVQYMGGKWIKDYDAPLEKLPVFQRIKV